MSWQLGVTSNDVGLDRNKWEEQGFPRTPEEGEKVTGITLTTMTGQPLNLEKQTGETDVEFLRRVNECGQALIALWRVQHPDRLISLTFYGDKASAYPRAYVYWSQL